MEETTARSTAITAPIPHVKAPYPPLHVADTYVPHIVVIGGGFAGLNLVQQLKKSNVRITLIDRQNHHLFQPLLYQVATAALGAPEIAEPIRDILRKQKNLTVLLGDVSAIDTTAKTVTFDDEMLAWDYLYVAAGASHSYFGNDHWAEFAPGLKTLDDAMEIRRRVIIAYERAERTDDPVERERELTFVVVGAGATGVELAGALAEIARHTMARNFRNFDPSAAKVLLVEAGPRVLANYDPELSDSAKAQLEGLGVTVMLDTRVTDITDDGVQLTDQFVPTSTVLWAAGVRSSPLGAMLGSPVDRAGRVIVEQNLTLPGRPDISVLGDLASVKGKDGNPVPGLAPAAMQMGRYAGKRLRNVLMSKEHKPFSYVDKGQMATIGKRRAVAQSGGVKLSGPIAWLAWAIIHVYFLVGFRNRVIVLLDWSWAYLTQRRGARILYGIHASEAAPREQRQLMRRGTELVGGGAIAERDNTATPR